MARNKAGGSGGALPKIGRGAFALGVFALFGAVLVAWTVELTRERIRTNEREAALHTLNQVLPPAEYDNELLGDRIAAVDRGLLGTTEPVTIYRARRDGEPVAAVLEPVAPDGYSGAIRLMVGIRRDGSLSAVRVLSHKETPGLGDAIEIERSNWIAQFAGRSLGDPPEDRWAVRKDDGAFDALSGATITPRAVIRAVRNALIYFERHREEIFAAPAGETLTSS